MSISTKSDSVQLVSEIGNLLNKYQSQRPFLVCGHSFMKLDAYHELLELPNYTFTPFHDYEPNPKYESVVKGLQLFRDSNSDLIISIGGGSPMDVAKSIKAFADMNEETPYVKQTITPNQISHIAIPTTAGTGSEVTHFAVIYYEGSKYSISDESLLPEEYILVPSLLNGLPLYQRKASMLDALCHSIESSWALKATNESRGYAAEAIIDWRESYTGYLRNEPDGNLGMLTAANLAGKAINISTTTAAHAMAYKLTSLFGIAHGHAVALCLPKIWRYMLDNPDDVQEGKTRQEVDDSFNKIAAAFELENASDVISLFEALVVDLELEVPKLAGPEQLQLLARSVNLQRLGNNPIKLNESAIATIYQEILR